MVRFLGIFKANFLVRLSFVWLVSLVSLHLSTYAQDKNIASIRLMEYKLCTDIEFELTKIADKIKEKDTGLVFFIKFVEEDSGYFISLSSNYDVNVNQVYIGYFYLKSKLFLISNQAPNIFFIPISESDVKFEIRTTKSEILDSYIDELPIWLIRYKDGQFINVYSSY